MVPEPLSIRPATRETCWSSKARPNRKRFRRRPRKATLDEAPVNREGSYIPESESLSEQHPKVAQLYEGALYKYRTFGSSGHSKALVVKGEVFFAPPSSLNDPFELRPFFVPMDKDDLKRVQKALRDNMVAQTPEAPANRYKVRKYIEKLFKLHTYELEMRKAIEARNAVFSGSKLIDSAQQWTYYADEQKGFAVEFEISRKTPFLVFEVSYEPTRLRIDVPRFFEDPTYQRTTGLKVMTTKQFGWCHEQEVRGLRVEAGTLWVPELFRGVYLGLKCPRANEQLMKEWIKESGRELPLYRMKENTENYGLDQERIA